MPKKKEITIVGKNEEIIENEPVKEEPVNVVSEPELETVMAPSIQEVGIKVPEGTTTTAQSGEYKPRVFFAQSAKFMLANDREPGNEEQRFTDGRIRQPSTIIQFEGHFYTTKNKQEEDHILKCYPPQDNGAPNKNVMPVDDRFISKFQKEEARKKKLPRKREMTEEDVSAMVARFDE